MRNCGDNMKKLIIAILVTLAVGELTVRAEMRVWTAKNGKSIEAEFVQVISDKVVLKKTNGKQIKVPISGLCAADQQYLESATPPKIEIDVNIDKDTKTVAGNGYNYEVKNDKVKGHVTITKKNRESSSKKFTAYLCIISEDRRNDTLWLLDKSQHGFSFKNQNKITFSGDKSSTSYYTGSNYRSSSRGWNGKYAGYLVIIEDDKGKVICTKGSRSLFEENVSRIRKAKKGSELEI